MIPRWNDFLLMIEPSLHYSKKIIQSKSLAK